MTSTQRSADPGSGPATSAIDGTAAIPGAARRGTRPGSGPGSGRAGSRLGAGLVDVPAVPPIDPTSALLVAPQVQESKRFCSSCGGAVGRGQDGEPGSTEGRCPSDGTPYSFTPKLTPGTIVGGQYEVAGCLAHGGLGWIYLAVDRNVENRWCVLKGLLDTGDDAATAAAVAEKKFLALVNHPNIVSILNFVEDETNVGYIVMEYVGGSSLRQLMEAGDEPMPVARAIAYALETLPALGYLHARGLVYCDFKPDNVIQYEHHVKLIDLGAVIRADDIYSAVFGTSGYQAPEVTSEGPSAASDLHTVGRTLAVLALGINPTQYGAPTPLPAGHPVLERHESFHRLLLRATDPDPDQRFSSAEEMAAQLAGVLREVLSADDGQPRTHVSTVFGPPRGTFAPSLLTGPDPAVVAAMLPVPLGDVPREWHAGVAALEAGDAEAAYVAFDAVYAALPGEAAPKLALAAAAECAGRDDAAGRFHALVGCPDPSLADAAFGRARVALRAGDRAGAIAALDAIPPTSSEYVGAQLAAVEAELTGPVTHVEVRRGAARVEALALDAATDNRVRATVFGAAIGLAPDELDLPGGPALLGTEFRERALRAGLERCLRTSARLTSNPDERNELVDRANAVRPRTWT